MIIMLHFFDLTLAISCFLGGAYIMVTSTVNTRQLKQAVPVLIGMLAWVILAMLASSVIYQLPLTGRINPAKGIWEYRLHRLFLGFIWAVYLMQVNRRHRVCLLGREKT